jgi:hypothetical protein
MGNTLENAFKIPFLLNAFFGLPDCMYNCFMFQCLETNVSLCFLVFQVSSSVIPQYRIVGFTETCYTRNLSMVGMLMGSADFCFVTITQRVLAALRVRAHYGHPDFVDGIICGILIK